MILLTGATGFIGKALMDRLISDDANMQIVAAVRRENLVFPNNVISMQVGDLLPTTDWLQALKGVSTVVHLAARVHVMNDQSSDPLTEFRLVNVEGTANLARQAAAAGVKRFVFLSSVKVNGEFTSKGQPFTANDLPAPADAYGVSKHEAEQLLHQISLETGMEVVVIRPPLVYGPGVKANFASMMRWVACGIPLPLAAVTENRRSLVALDNLVDVIVTCITHPAAANQTFLVSDGEDLSTAELLKRTGTALGIPARLFYVPLSVLKFGSAVLKKPGLYQRLCGSLQIDIDKTKQLLGWTSPVPVNEGLRRAAKGLAP